MKLFTLLVSFMLLISTANVISQHTLPSKIKTTKTIYVSIGGKTGGNISKKELLAFNELQLINDVDSSYHLISYTVYMICRGWDVYEVNSNSSKITEPVKKGFMRLDKNGCRVDFCNIKCLGKNNDTLQLNIISFHINENSLKQK